MLDKKTFLQEEYRNVQQLLSDTLRYSYAASVKERFWNECTLRLKTLIEQIEACEKDDTLALHGLQTELSQLSALITRIERSHIGEFSWPFANKLNDLALSCCRADEKDLDDNPLFFFSADGGIHSYRVHFEQDDNSFHKSPIFNVVFPRSLKHSVLLHPILAHELGHAVCRRSKKWRELETKVLIPLTKNSPVESKESLNDWIDNQGYARIDDNFATEILESWREELLVDLFGLVMTGPSFLAAHQSLLSTLDPTGDSISSSHPPDVARFKMLNDAADFLGWNKIQQKGSVQLKESAKTYFETLSVATTGIDPTLDFFDYEHLKHATTSLVKFLHDHNALYEPSSCETQQKIVSLLLRSLPSIGSKVVNGEPVNENVDFRTILYCGWLAWHSQARSEELNFAKINNLCGRAILQQAAIEIWENNLDVGT